MGAKEFFAALKSRVVYVLGGFAAALAFVAAVLVGVFFRKAGAGENATEDAEKASEAFRKEKEEIEEKACEAYHAMYDHLSSIPACELCDDYGDARDAICDGKLRLGRRFDEYRAALHAGRGGRDD